MNLLHPALVTCCTLPWSIMNLLHAAYYEPAAPCLGRQIGNGAVQLEDEGTIQWRGSLIAHAAAWFLLTVLVYYTLTTRLLFLSAVARYNMLTADTYRHFGESLKLALHTLLRVWFSCALCPGNVPFNCCLF